MAPYIGIDISKPYFDADIDGQVTRFKNSAEGHERFLRALPSNAVCVMESTANYGYRLAHVLARAGIGVAIVNPLAVKRFAQAQFRRAKTDRVDAQLLTSFARAVPLTMFTLVSDSMNELQQLDTALKQLIKQRTALHNQVEALQQLPYRSKGALAVIQSTIKHLDKAIAGLKKKMHAQAMVECPELYARLLSIPGIGQRAAIMLITATNAFRRFDSAKELVAYLGLCPQISQSGPRPPAQGHLCKLGMGYERSILYLCAMAALRSNDPCKIFFQRLVAKGKHKMVALMAVAHKLLRQAFAIANSKISFQQDYHCSLVS